jgi:hypothetical protein
VWNFAKPYLNGSKEELIENFKKLSLFCQQQEFKDLCYRLFAVGENASLSNLMIEINLGNLDLTSKNYLIH